ncbi:MAG: zinc ribbon domain-containing protein [Oscillibacter sp.]|nr:zinc ribbon domain-containing protein [Oscillibacter sp.]
MAFSIDELTKKAKDMAAAAADKAKGAADLAKINVAIAGEQREIDKTFRSIGEWFVNEYEGEIPDTVRELVEAVNASKAKIAELEASKPVKAEEEAGAPDEAETAGKACPICGAVSDSKFCPQCGAPME